MPFRIFFHPKAEKAFKKLDKEIGNRIKHKISELESLPEKKGERLTNLSFWKLRVGDYRAIYEINRHAQTVLVLFIGHRKNVYDDFSKLF